jgi:protein-disulfide isomerase
VITRRVLNAALSLSGLATLAEFSPLRLIDPAGAQATSTAAKPDTPKPDAAKADPAKPVSLPDMVLGEANAPVTIIEYAAPTCPHCGRFSQQVFPKIKSQYIDTGKVRYVFREFPLNQVDAAAFLLARRVANGDSAKYFAIIDTEFKQQNALAEKPGDTLQRIGKQAGLSPQLIKEFLSDQALMDKIVADEKYASESLKVEGTPTFFINGEMVVGELSFDEMDAKIKPLLKS